MEQACFYSKNNLHDTKQPDLPPRLNESMLVLPTQKKSLLKKWNYILAFCLAMVFSSSIFAINLNVSGITESPYTDANGIYISQGTLNGAEYWKHQTKSYYIYYAPYSGGGVYWNLDVNTEDEDNLPDANGVIASSTSGEVSTAPPIGISFNSGSSGFTSGFSITIAEYSTVPEIDISGNGNSITSGDNTPSFADYTKFASTNVSGGASTRTYTIYNTGTVDALTVGTITIGGTNAADFTVTTPPASTVAASGLTTFIITFNPSSSGEKIATVSIVNNDSNENPYTFTISGYGYTAKNLVVSGITSPSAANGTYTHQGVSGDFQYWKHSTLEYYIYYSLSVRNWIISNTSTTGGTWYFYSFSDLYSPTGLTYTPSSPWTGTVVVNEEVAVPNINIKVGAYAISNGSVTTLFANNTNFGSLEVASGTRARSYTIENTGNATLTLSGASPYFTITGTNASDFSVSTTPSNSILASATTTFGITFNPSAAGTRTATVTVLSNDPDKATYTFAIQGEGVTPRNLVVSNITAPSAANGTYIYQGLLNEFQYWKHSTQNYYIYNSKLNGIDPVWYIDVNTSADLYTPSSYNFYSQTDYVSPVSVSSWTSSSGNSGTPTIQYTEPEINITGNLINIISGDNTPSLYDFTDLGWVVSGSISKTFTIQNTGIATLNLTGTSPYITFSGADASQFSITSIPSPTIAAGSSTTFGVTFTPSSGTLGARTATLSIANDDSNENPYTFSVQSGVGVLPVVTTQAVSGIGTTTATGNGNITTLGSPNPTSYGICYGTTINPDVTGSKVDKGAASATGAFIAQLTGLTIGTTYHARAFATNNVGTVYGDDVIFATNSIPVIAINDATLSYTENAAAIQIDAAATLSDADGDADWNGGKLEVQITTNNEAADEISIPDVVGSINTSGADLQNGATVIGALNASEGTVTNGTKLIITFNENATNALVQQVLQAIHYRNTSDTPGTSNRTITFTATDKNTGSSSDTRTVSITAVNDAPTLTATGTNPTFTEGGSASDLYSSVTASTIESGQNLIELVLTVTNVNNGSNEILSIDGSDVALTNSNSLTTLTNSMSVSVSVTGTTATVTVSKVAGINVAAMQTLVDGIIYRNTGENPNTTSRVVTLTSIKDNGGVAVGGDDTKALSIASSVTIVAVNDNPAITGLPANITVNEDVASNVNLSATTFSDADAGSNNVTLRIVAGAGTLSASSGGSVIITGSGTGTLTLTGTAANIDTYLNTTSNILYTSILNTNGTNATTLTLTANDGGFTGTGGGTNVSLGTVNVNITAVNDDPAITGLPSNITVTEDVASNVDFSSATLTDVDAGASNITLTIVAGAGTLSATSGGSVTISGSGTATLTLSGAVANIDAYLNIASNIKYTSVLNANGENATTLTLTANDGGFTGTGGGTNVSLGSVNVDITAVNDAPTLTSFAGIVETTTQNTEVEITLAELKAQGNQADVDGTVDAFIVNVVSTGMLKIGANAIAATPFNATTNKTINATNNAYWTPANNAYGTLNAFTTTVMDNNGDESTGAVQATVRVNDITAPSVSSITISGSPAVTAPSITFVVAFSEPVVNVSTDDFSLTSTGTAAGTIASVSSSSGTSIDVTVNSITGTGSIRLDLLSSTNIADVSLNTPPAAYASGSVHTVDLDGPALSSSIPIDGAAGVATSSNITLTFSENIAFGTGNIQIIDLDNGSSTVTINAASPGTQASISTNTLTLNPTSDLEELTNYAIQIAATAIDDVYGNSYAGISDNTTLNFQVADITPPVLLSSTPSDNATNATLSGNIVLNFDDILVAGTGNVTIMRSSDNGIFEQIAITDSRITVSGTQLTINPTGIFAKGTGYYIEIDPTALDDDAGNSFAGISGSSTLNFTTVDVVINEVVTEPQTDWSTNIFNGTNGGGPVSEIDEWVELFIKSSGIDLSVGWTLEVSSNAFSGSLNADGAFEISRYVGGTGSISNTASGSYLVLGNPISSYQMTNSTIITLKDPGGAVVDAVTLFNSSAPSANSDNIFNESAQRFPNGTDTDTNTDWTQGQASMGTANTGPSVSFNTASSSGLESVSSANLQVDLSAKCGVPVTVNYTVTGTATGGGVDYTLANGTLTIDAGTTNKNITIASIINDLVVEGDETVVVTLSSPVNATLGAITVHTYTITDDDVAVLTIAATIQAEEDATDGEFTISTDKQFDAPVTVTFTVGGDATSGTDYTAIGTTVVFPAFSSTVTIPVEVIADNLVESDETVIVSMTTTSNSNVSVAAAPDSSATVTITDNDVAVLTIAATAQAEEDATDGEFTISTDKQFDAPVTVTFTVGGDATSGTDYTAIGTTVVFPAFSSTVTIPVEVIADNLIESNETVIVSMTATSNSNVSVAVAPDSSATVTITDDDVAVLTIAATAQAEEDATDGEFTISTDKQFDAPVTVTFVVTGSATSGTDYTAIGTTVVFPAFSSTVTIPVELIADNLVESDETVIVSMTTTSNSNVSVAVAPDSSATVTITDDDVAVLSIAATTQAEEDATDGEFTISTDKQFDAPVTVTFTVGGDAASATDYAAIGTTVVFPAFSSTVTIPVEVIADNLVESDETVIVSMTTTSNSNVSVAVAPDSSATVTITDDDVAVLTIAATAQAEEDATDGEFTISTDKQFDAPVTVTFVVTGSATSGTDYTAIGTTVVFPAFSSTVTIPVELIADNLVESDETVIVSMTTTSNSNVSVAAAPDSSATVTITDDDVAVLSIAATTQAEEDATDGEFTISTDKQFDAPVTVTFTVGGDAASGTDYAAIGTTVVFPAFSSTVTIPVELIADNLVESDETVIVSMTTTSNSNVSVAAAPDSSATVTITDDDVAVLTIAATAQAEEDATDGEFTISTDKQFDAPVTVTFTVGGDATSGTDYTAIGTTVVFPAFSSTVTIPVEVIADNLVESDETVIVSMTTTSNSNVSVAAAPDSSATVTITDNDVAVLTIAATAQAEEDATDGEFTISTDKQFDAPVTVTFTVGGDATSGTDYTAIGTTVVFPAFSSTITIPVEVIADNLIESNETVIVSMTATSNSNVSVAVAPDSSATVTITDDDVAVLTIAATAQAEEDATDGEFTISTDKQFDAPVTVTFVVTGSATSGTDYTAIGTTVVFPAFSSTVTIPVELIADNLVESDETVIVSMTTTSNSNVSVAVAPDSSATVTITDDDVAVLSIAATTQAEEDATDGEFTISTDKQFDAPVTVTFTVGGDAASATDYAAIGTTVVFPAFSSTVTIPVEVIADNLVESDETVIVSMTTTSNSNVSVAVAPDSSATVTITDDDVAVLTIAATAQAEEDATDGEFTISTDKQFDAPVTVTFVVTGSATSGTDYTAIGTTVVFPAFSSTVTIPVELIADNLVESDETVIVSMTTTSNSNVSVAAAPDSSATVTITDDDVAVLTIAATAQAEEDATDGEFTISTDKQFDAPVTVTFTVGGDATSGTDYTAIGTTVVFPAFSSTVTIPVEVIADNLVESDETVIVSMTTTSNSDVSVAAAPDSSATVTITDDDVAMLTIAATAQAEEDATDGEFTISTDKQFDAPVTVTFTVGGDATSGTDYTAIGTTVVFPAFSSTVTIPVEVIADYLVESDETVIVTMTTTSNLNVTIAAPPASTATVTITDDDVPPTVTTTAASSITTTSAILGGNVTDGGSVAVTERGVVYSSADDTPTIGETGVIKESNGDGTGTFDEPITSLSINTRYYVNAYATNAVGTSYGTASNFVTHANIPGAPIVDGSTANSLNVAVNVNLNPDATEFAIYETSTVKFVQANGSLGSTVVWQTAAQWHVDVSNTRITVNGLSVGVTYTFRVKARNADNFETDYGESTTGITCTNPTVAGTIGSDQIICSGGTPSPLTSILGASNYGGTLEYKWQHSTTDETTGFTDISDSDSDDFVPGTLTVTTWFKRLARVSCRGDWTGAVESNVVKITIDETPPVVSAKTGSTVTLDPTGNYTLLSADLLNSFSDAGVGVESVAIVPPTVNCTNIGLTTVTVTVTDSCGNHTVVTPQITVLEGSALLSPWISCMVGASNGTTTYSPCTNNGTFTLTSTGLSSSNADIQEFTYQTIGNTGTVIARVSEIENGGWLGVEMRESCASNAKTVLFKTRYYNSNVIIGYRTATGKSMTNVSQTAQLTRWMKIQRNGTQFTVYTSVNGTTWTKKYTATVSMSTNILAGIFTESVRSDRTSIAQFDHAEVSTSIKSAEILDDETIATGQQVDIYPNPADELVNIVMPDNEAKVKVTMTSMQGNVVLTTIFYGSEAQINTSHLNPGVYVLRFETEGNVITKRLVIM